LLGFIEGDGCFNIDFAKTKNSHIRLSFRLLIIQSAIDLALLLAIKNYINSLAVSASNSLDLTLIMDLQDKELEGLGRNYVGLFSSTNKKISKLNEKYNLTVGNMDFIKDTLLPFFDSLTFYTKKELDYQD